MAPAQGAVTALALLATAFLIKPGGIGVLSIWAHAQPLSPAPSGPFPTFQPFCPSLELQGVGVTQGQDPGLVEPHTTGLSPWTQTVQILLQSILTLNPNPNPDVEAKYTVKTTVPKYSRSSYS